MDRPKSMAGRTSSSPPPTNTECDSTVDVIADRSPTSTHILTVSFDNPPQETRRLCGYWSDESKYEGMKLEMGETMMMIKTQDFISLFTNTSRSDVLPVTVDNLLVNSLAHEELLGP